jgi:hypothetical protein
MVQPYNYGALLAPTTPLDGSAFLQGAQAGQVIAGNLQQRQVAEAQSAALQQQARIAQEQARAKAERDAARNAALAQLTKPGSRREDFARVAIEFPEIQEQLQKSVAMMSDAERATKYEVGARVLSAIEAGRPEIAYGVLEAEAKRNEVSGRPDEAVAFRQRIEDLKADAPGARARIGVWLAATDPEKFAKIEADIRSNPATVQKAEADADKALMQSMAEGKKIATELALTQAQTFKLYKDAERDAAMLGIERDKLALMQLKAQQEAMALAGGAPLETDERKAVGEAANVAIKEGAGADRVAALAVRMRDLARKEGASGVVARATRTFQEFFGSEDESTALRKEFESFINQGVVDNLPPGAASENDVAMVRAGFPGAGASAEYAANWLDSYARVKRDVAKVKRAESMWIAANQGGSIGPARRSFVIDGRQVNPGDNFVDFVATPQPQQKSRFSRRTAQGTTGQ